MDALKDFRKVPRVPRGKSTTIIKDPNRPRFTPTALKKTKSTYNGTIRSVDKIDIQKMVVSMAIVVVVVTVTRSVPRGRRGVKKTSYMSVIDDAMEIIYSSKTPFRKAVNKLTVDNNATIVSESNAFFVQNMAGNS